ncbi:protein insensitive-like [Leguminivora glycinivorella]|uniref:protein insensitive-like n=1 Tax=Leguminivora glycinivorella TaxID=1035111 RepID=UPI00200F7028|nr:protein insensitive-like [Leguminivora glycinivorella]XP_047992445.1 protein insensitive-like [Leguminivora glycinivorella]
MQQLAIQNSMKSRKSHDMRQNPAQKYGLVDKESVPELITSMESMFQDLFTILSKMKSDFNLTNITKQSALEVGPAISHDNCEYVKNETNYNDTQGDERMDSEYSDRSDDNVLITNRYDTVDKKHAKSAKNEWVPIGSGTTLIHRDKYRKVNWKSYTVATRTLLLAAFSKRILATHSLTGKKSPAFTNKPAKMCLDPKIVSDIVIEITDKFKVKDNLVRSIITTKCADECKMYKMQKNKHNAADKKKSKKENIPPAANNTA